MSTKETTTGSNLREMLLNQALQIIIEAEKECIALFDQQIAYRKLGEAKAAREADIYVDICSKQTADNKPAFSNDGARKAELTRLTNQDSILGNMREQLEQAEVDIARRKFGIERRNGEIDLRKAFLHGGG